MRAIRFIKNNREVIKEIFKISLPAVLDLLAQTLLSAIDMAMVGKKGPSAISAVALGNTAFNMIMPAFMSIAVGTIAILSRSYGSNNREEGLDSIVQSLILCIPLSIVITFAYMFWSEDIINLIARGDGLDIRSAINYHNIVSLGFMPLAFTTIFLAAYRSIGKANIPMTINIISLFINVILNYLFIFTFDYGVEGAAAATSLTRLIVLLFFVYITFYTNRYWVSMKWKQIKYNSIMLKRIIKTSVPAAIEQLSLRFGMLIFEIMVISLGNIAYAAHKIATVAESFSFNMGFAFSMAAAALVGQQLGANKPDKAETNGLIAMTLGIIVMSFMAILFFTIPDLIISIFTQEVETKKLATQALRIVGTCQPFLAISMIISGALRGAGDTKSVLLVTFLGIFVVRLVLTYLFLNVLQTGLAGAWWVMTIDLSIRSFLCYKIFRKGRWRYINV